MKTNSTSTELLMLAPLLLTITYVATLWNQLPARIPVHYDALGNVNGWADKDAMAWEGIGLLVFMYVLLRFLPRVDPKGRLQSANFQKIRFVIMLFLPLIMAGIFYMAAHPSDSKALLGPELALVSLLIAGIGNYMTTVKPNWFVGIRTPWTLDNETVWRKTHQLGGRLMVAGGLLSAVLALIVPMPYTVAIVAGIIILSALIPTVYSYIYFRQEKAHQLN